MIIANLNICQPVIANNFGGQITLQNFNLKIILKMVLKNNLQLILVLITVFLYTCTEEKKIKSELIRSNRIIINYIIDTIIFPSPNLKLGNPNYYNISFYKTSKQNNFLSIGNVFDNKIYIYDFDNKNIINSINIFSEGPNQTISQNNLFYHHFINDTTILILANGTNKLSVINLKGEKLYSLKIPQTNENYGYFVDWMISGISSKSQFIYPVAPWVSFPNNKKDPIYKNLKHILVFKNNQITFEINRSNFYTADSIFYFENCCLSNFIDTDGENLYLSDCVNPDIHYYNLNNFKKKGSFSMPSLSFKKINPYPIKYTKETFFEINSDQYRDLLEFGHKQPSYLKIFTDTINKVIIRQAKLGMTDDEHKGDRTKWAHSFILNDLSDFSYINEFVIKRGEYKHINFLKGFMTSDGLYFPFDFIQGNERTEKLYFIRIRFQ